MNAKRHEIFADKVLNLSTIIGAILTATLAVLCYVKIDGTTIFSYSYSNLEPHDMLMYLTICSIVLFVFGCVRLIFKLHHKITRYIGIVIGIITSMMICIYTKFDFISVFIIPAIASSLYYSKKMTYFTEILTIVGLFLSYFFSSYVLKIYSPNGDLFSDILIRLCLPNVLIYIFIAFMFNNLAQDTSDLKRASFQKSRTINAQNAALDELIDNSLVIFGASSLDDFDSIVRESLTELVTPFLENKGLPVRINIGHISNKEYVYADNDGALHRAIKGTEKVKVNLGIRNIEIALKRHDNAFSIEITNEQIVISFFNNNSLIHFIVVDALIKPTETLEEIIKILANNIGIALRNLKLNLDLLDSQAEMIYSFSKVTDSRSHYTGNHIKRVSEYMRVLAIGAGYSKDHANKISVASMMHDIGKILIPLEILEKDSNLSDKEYEIMKTHTTKGVELIQNCPGDIMNMAKIMIREHHERWDGNGYLKIPGSKIHTISRLITVADVFDALISERPYKEAWPADKVRQTIVSESGTHFDPRIVSIFVKHFDELVAIYEKYKG